MPFLGSSVEGMANVSEAVAMSYAENINTDNNERPLPTSNMGEVHQHATKNTLEQTYYLPMKILKFNNSITQTQPVRDEGC